MDEFWSGGCDVFVIRAACGGQGGKLGFGVSLHLCSPDSCLALWECRPGSASHVPLHFALRRKGQLPVESATSPQHSLVTV